MKFLKKHTRTALLKVLLIFVPYPVEYHYWNYVLWGESLVNLSYCWNVISNIFYQFSSTCVRHCYLWGAHCSKASGLESLGTVEKKVSTVFIVRPGRIFEHLDNPFALRTQGWSKVVLGVHFIRIRVWFCCKKKLKISGGVSGHLKHGPFIEKRWNLVISLYYAFLLFSPRWLFFLLCAHRRFVQSTPISQHLATYSILRWFWIDDPVSK